MNISKQEKVILKKALVEYEKNHYEYEDEDWQKTINSLINKVEQDE